MTFCRVTTFETALVVESQQMFLTNFLGAWSEEKAMLHCLAYQENQTRYRSQLLHASTRCAPMDSPPDGQKLSEVEMGEAATT